MARHTDLWRPEAPGGYPQHDMNPYGYPFRTCGHCGSVHPADLLRLMGEHPILLSQADWKYGWPHKLYIEGIPNPLAGQRVASSGQYVDGKFVPEYGPAPAMTFAKFYTEHVADLEGEELARLRSTLRDHIGIDFEPTDDGRLQWRVVAPDRDRVELLKRWSAPG